MTRTTTVKTIEYDKQGRVVKETTTTTTEPSHHYYTPYVPSLQKWYPTYVTPAFWGSGSISGGGSLTYNNFSSTDSPK